MSKIKDNLRWNLYNLKRKTLLIWGLQKGYIAPYDEELITKLRSIYYGSLPASIILLSSKLSNGFCYDRALLISQAFLDTEDDINLIYVSTDDLKLNPMYSSMEDENFADHCILERITNKGNHVIYDTSMGLQYDKDLYWKIEKPIVRMTKDKNSIKKYVLEEASAHPEVKEPYAALITLPMIEQSLEINEGMYASPGVELLQREIDIFKKEIGYDELRQQIRAEMEARKLKKTYKI